MVEATSARQSDSRDPLRTPHRGRADKLRTQEHTMTSIGSKPVQPLNLKPAISPVDAKPVEATNVPHAAQAHVAGTAADATNGQQAAHTIGAEPLLPFSTHMLLASTGLPRQSMLDIRTAAFKVLQERVQAEHVIHASQQFGLVTPEAAAQQLAELHAAVEPKFDAFRKELGLQRAVAPSTPAEAAQRLENGIGRIR
jgi:hypothetical protein